MLLVWRPHVNVPFHMVVVWAVTHASVLTQMLGHQGGMVPGMVPGHPQQPPPEKKKPHVKKPLNAFMLFMREKRADVMKECSLKESAAINQILGKMVCGEGSVWLLGGEDARACVSAVLCN